jgi:uncharacterized protein (DUF2235 family)
MTAADWKLAATFRKTYGRRIGTEEGGNTSRIPIHFLGLWDTVSTFGWVWDPIFLPHTSNNSSVEVVRHALAIDERRLFFRQLHWGTENRDSQDVKEVWFAGVHSDVGGGYPEDESALAKVALDWMVGEAMQFGLVVNQAAYEAYVLGKSNNYVEPSPLGQEHHSLKGLWWLAEFAPKRVWDHDRGRKAMRLPSPNRPRRIPTRPRPVVHRAVLERMNKGNYAPPNLPPLASIGETFDIE